MEFVRLTALTDFGRTANEFTELTVRLGFCSSFLFGPKIVAFESEQRYLFTTSAYICTLILTYPYFCRQILERVCKVIEIYPSRILIAYL